MLTVILDKIDGLLISLNIIVSLKLKRKYSWRLGNVIEKKIIVFHESFLHFVKQIECSTRKNNLKNQITSYSMKCRPKHPSPAAAFGVNLDNDKIFKSMVNGKYNECQNISWLKDPYGDKSSFSRLLFHSLEWVRKLQELYYETMDKKYLDKAKILTKTWIDQCLYTAQFENSSDEIWDDHGSAMRLIVLCQIWYTCKLNQSEDHVFLYRLERAISRHSRILSNRYFYRPEHNHGIVQAYSLLISGLLFSGYRNSRRWIKLSMLWLEKQMQNNISIDGIHLEHSPYYHFFVLRHFVDAHEIAFNYGFHFSDNFYERLILMFKSGLKFIKPNGNLIAMGDTNQNSPILINDADFIKFQTNMPSLSHKFFSNLQLMSHELESLFESSGLVIWSTKRNNQNKKHSIYFILRLSLFKTAHIHKDLFSFELNFDGTDLIVDSGGPFEYIESRERNYFVSTAAHNTVLVNEENQKITRSKILNYKSNSKFKIIDAEHDAYFGVKHRRTVLLVDNIFFLIIDRLLSNQKNKYSQIFHLDHQLDIKVDKFNISAYNSKTGINVKIIPIDIEYLNINTLRGSLTPYQGWICVGERSLRPNWTIEYTKFRSSTCFITLIVPSHANTYQETDWKLYYAKNNEDKELNIMINNNTYNFKINEDIVIL